jgi:hypothetical protein
MAFDVYPDPPTAPLSLAKGVPSALIPFTEHAAIDPATGRNTMYIALIKLGSGSASPGPPAPTIRLQVNAGTPVDIGTDTPLPNADQPVALATGTTAGPDRFLIEIEILQANNTWQLQILHVGPADTHEFTWVVADTRSQVQQPWINAPGSVTFEVLTGEQGSKTVQIVNNGTGSLTLSDPDQTNLTHGFTLDTLTPRTVPPHGHAQATITFTGPTAPGPSNAEWAITSNDPRATSQQGHNKLVKLAAIVDTVQSDWRWCRNCQCLAFTHWPGKCAGAAVSAGPHDYTGSGRYSVPYESQPPGTQPDWRWCRNCQCLAFTHWPGKCAAGGPHDHTGSGRYSVYYTG